MFRTRVCGTCLFACFAAESLGRAGQAPAAIKPPAPPAGQVTHLKGNARWRASSSAPEEPLNEGRKLYPGEAVLCLSGCAMTLQLFETTVQITEKSGWYPIPKAAEETIPGLSRGGRSAQLEEGPPGTLLMSPGPSQPNKRVAVLDFDYGTVQSSVASIFGSNKDIGKGMRDLLVQRLLADGRYTVIDGKAVDEILKEQNFSNSDRPDSYAAARLGRILGADAIIVGSITQFGRDDKKPSMAGGGFGRYGLGVSRKSGKAVVAVTTRMINTDTAEILTAVTGQGESERSGTSLVGAPGSWADTASGGIDMRTSSFASTILGEAVNKAVTNVALQLDSKSTQLPNRKMELDGMVADVSGAQLIVNIGSKAGVHVGDHLIVLRKQGDVSDPTTGKVLRPIEDKVGEVVITEVNEQSSVGRYSGDGPVKVGDTVRPRQE